MGLWVHKQPSLEYTSSAIAIAATMAFPDHNLIGKNERHPTGIFRTTALQIDDVKRGLQSTSEDGGILPRSRDFILPRDRPDKSVGELIEFELFDGIVMTGVVNNVIDRGDRSATWSGSLIVGYDESSAFVSPTD
eukprot:gene13641-28969_t